MAFDPPQGAAGVFAPSVTADDLAPYAAQGNPPVYVSGVTYGRIFYILFESSSSQMDLEAAVKGNLEPVMVGLGICGLKPTTRVRWRNCPTIAFYPR